MRAAPAFQVSLTRFGVWRGAVYVLSACGVVTLGAWLATREAPLDAPVSLLTALAVALAVALGMSTAKTSAWQLRWDGRAWHLSDGSRETMSGDLSVAVDLGHWMLLRFSADAPTRVVWLPAQRRGLESAWHALRCSVYSPRPVTTDDSPAGF